MMAEMNAAASSVVALHERMVGMKREAYALLDQALTADSSSSSSSSSSGPSPSVGLYQKALGIITNAIELYRANSASLGKLEEAVVLYNQLVRMRAQTAERLEYLQSTANASSNYIQPTTLAPSANFNNNAFLELADEVLSDDEFLIVDDNETQAATSSKSKLQTRLGMDEKFAKATEICRVDNGVQLFYIANDGSVSTPSHPTTLSIYAFNE